MKELIIVKTKKAREAIQKIFRYCCLRESSLDNETFLIKPNLVSDYPPPITTPVDIVEAVIEYIKGQVKSPQIIIAEGTASLKLDTWEVFSRLGYIDLAERTGVELMDLNQEPLTRLECNEHLFFRQIWLPTIVFDSFLISLPVLKAHTLAGVTLSLKNMIGLLPPVHYQEPGHWKKSLCHRDIQRAIYELNSFRSPDLTILDARRGLKESHLSGPELDPPPGIICGGKSAWKVDAYGATLLGRDWRQIDHILLASRNGGVDGN